MPNYTLAQKDCVEWLRTLPDESVDLAVTDYAYESLEKHRKIGTTTRLKQSDASSNVWFDIFPNVRVPELMTEFYRVLKKDAHLYMMSDQDTMIDVIRPMGREAGFYWWKSLCWAKIKGKDDKPVDLETELTAEQLRFGMGYHWRNCKEEISFLEKGKRKLNFLGWPDILPAPRIDHGYPTEKPVALWERLIENSSRPGDLVIDPFMGSGSSGVAALRLGRNFAGCDLADLSLKTARERFAPLGTEVKLPERESVLDLFT